MSPDRKVYIDRLILGGLSERSLRNYVEPLVKASRFHNKSPLQMDSYEIEQFLLHELQVEKLLPSTVNIHIAAFKKFFSVMVPGSKLIEHITKVKEVHKLPVVLTLDEVGAMLRCTNNIKHRAIIEVLYSSGVRLDECVNLKWGDIDRRQMLLNVECGKGSRQRYTILGHSTLQTLCDYYRIYRPGEYIFEGRDRKGPISNRMVITVVARAAKRARINKPVSPHTMRHCFATHLLEQNVSLRVIQKLLGHASIKTTTIYLQVSNAVISNVANPLDLLYASGKGKAL
jgi:integrase/recombinase XerD